MRNSILLFTFILFAVSSCTPYKDLLLFQANEKDTTSVQLIVDTAYRPKIQPNDILDVFVMSTSPEASKYFNYSTEVGNSTELSGYLVDQNGEIDLPIVGRVRLNGLNSSDATDTV